MKTATVLSAEDQVMHVQPTRRQKPLFVFDGECPFCRYWVKKWAQRTGDRIEYAPYQEVASQFPEISEGEFAQSVVMITPDGETYKAAEAVFRALATQRHSSLIWAYRKIPGFAWLTEKSYHWVSHHRDWAWKATKLLGGSEPT